MDNISTHGNAQVRCTCENCVTAEQQLFGRFFKDVVGCRVLMKEKQVIASGSAVLHALMAKPTWEPSDLDLYVSRRSQTKNGLLEWHTFFRQEGYSVAKNSRSDVYGDGEVGGRHAYRELILIKISTC